MKSWWTGLVLGIVVVTLSAYPIWFVLFERPRAGMPLRWFHVSPFVSVLLGLKLIASAVLRREPSRPRSSPPGR